MSEVRLIDANAYAAEMKVRQDECKRLLDATKTHWDEKVYDRMNTAFGVFVEAKLTLDNMPTVDAVPVVRCKDCRFWNRDHISCEGLARCLTGESGIRFRTARDFCSRARPIDRERRSE